MRRGEQVPCWLFPNSLMTRRISQHAIAQKRLNSLLQSAKSRSLVHLTDILCNQMKTSTKLITQGLNQALFLLQL